MVRRTRNIPIPYTARNLKPETDLDAGHLIPDAPRKGNNKDLESDLEFILIKNPIRIPNSKEADTPTNLIVLESNNESWASAPHSTLMDPEPSQGGTRGRGTPECLDLCKINK